MIRVRITTRLGVVLYEAMLQIGGPLRLPDIGEKSIRFNGRIFEYPCILEMLFVPQGKDKIEL